MVLTCSRPTYEADVLNRQIHQGIAHHALDGDMCCVVLGVVRHTDGLDVIRVVPALKHPQGLGRHQLDAGRVSDSQGLAVDPIYDLPGPI